MEIKQDSPIQLGIWNIRPDLNSILELADAFDFLFIDLEHGMRCISDLTTAVSFLNTKQKAYSVRVRSHNDPLIQTLVDLGVRHFILPQVRSISTIDLFCQKLHSPPRGQRGTHPRVRLPGNAPTAEDISLTVIIETKESLLILEDIVNHPSVSDVYLGVYDLASELQIENDQYSLEIQKYYGVVRQACLKFGKKFVGMLPNQSDTKFAHDQGFDKVVIGIDSIMTHQLFRSVVDSFLDKKS